MNIRSVQHARHLSLRDKEKCEFLSKDQDVELVFLYAHISPVETASIARDWF